jgi:hypothetical protein
VIRDVEADQLKCVILGQGDANGQYSIRVPRLASEGACVSLKLILTKALVRSLPFDDDSIVGAISIGSNIQIVNYDLSGLASRSEVTLEVIAVEAREVAQKIAVANAGQNPLFVTTTALFNEFWDS